MNYRWIALEPIQVLQSLIASPVTLVAGRPFLVRGYVQLEDWSQEFAAHLEVVIVDIDNNEKVDYTKIDGTKHAMRETIDRSTTEYLSQLKLKDSEYLPLCRNTLGNSINWFIQPEDFDKGLKGLKTGKKYFLELNAIADHPSNISNKHSQEKISNIGATQHRSETVLKSYDQLDSKNLVFGQDFGAFFIAGDAELRVNVLGLRYRDQYGDDEFSTVEDHQYERAWSYLAASFPIGKLYWTSLNINAPASFAPPFTSGQRSGTDYLLHAQIDTANAFVAAVRANDINIGADLGTIYYGMMNQADNEFEGAASDVPRDPSHLAVATGPADNTTGYYCAHELGHLFGLTHKGGATQKPESDDGWISRMHRASNQRRDDTLLSMDRDGFHQQRLAWWDTVDLMSYGERTWPGYETYYDLQERLDGLHKLQKDCEKRSKDSNKQRSSKGSKKPQPSEVSKAEHPNQVQTNVLFISGTYDLRSGEGQLQYVLPLQHHHNFMEEIEQNRASEDSALPSGLSLFVQPINDAKGKNKNESNDKNKPDSRVNIISGSRVKIEENQLVIRREKLNFPKDIGMFQALITAADLTSILKSEEKLKSDISSASWNPSWLLTLACTTNVLDSGGGHSSKKFTQLDQVEIKRVRQQKQPHVYGRIRPSELNLRPTDDGRGFYLRIDKQLEFNSLIDCSFIVEACSIDEAFSNDEMSSSNEASSAEQPSVWRTVALNARVGEDVFLDARINGALRLTESVHQRNQLHHGAGGNKSERTDEDLATLLEFDERTVNREKRIETAGQLLAAHNDGGQDLVLSDRSRTFVARIRIVATRGLDKVIVFDGLIEQSAVLAHRAICVSIDREHRVQHLDCTGVVTQNNMDIEDQIVNSLLLKSRRIFNAMETTAFNLDAMPLKDLYVRDAIMILADLQGVVVKDPKTTSGEFQLVRRVPEKQKAIEQVRTVFYSFKNNCHNSSMKEYHDIQTNTKPERQLSTYKKSR